MFLAGKTPSPTPPVTWLTPLLAVYALAAVACTVTKIPETHAVNLALTREWHALPAGPQPLSLTVHTAGDSMERTGGTFLEPIYTTPVELTLSGADGQALAHFAAADVNHTHETQQIPGMGRGETREVDTFDGHNADGVRISGTVVCQYAMHYVNNNATNAWILKAELDLADSSGPLGHISATEYVDW